MLPELVGPSVVAVERFGDEAAVPLFAVERAVIARAVPRRRREFATVRHCARLALAALGTAPVPLVPDPRGAPSWPAGVLGSLTHCAGYRAAAVARDADVRWLGIDAEEHAPLPAGVLDLVARPAERLRLARLAAARPGVHWDRLLFSAKEAVYKAWYPLTRSWLGFEEAELTIDPTGATFTAAILVPTPAGGGPTALRGRWTVSRDLIVTAIADPA